MKPSPEIETEIAEMEVAIENAPPSTLVKVKNNLREINKSLDLFPDSPVRGELRNKILALLKKAGRRQIEEELTSRPVKVNNYIVSNEVRAKGFQQNLPLDTPVRFFPLGGEEEQITSGEVVSKYQAVLATKEAGYIQDAVFEYARRFYSGEKNVSMRLEGDYYVLSTTFNDFCRAGGIRGEDRGAVLRSLENGLLEQVGFIVEKNGQVQYIEKRYISRRTMVKGKRRQSENLKRPKIAPEQGLTPEEQASLSQVETAFELDIDAILFSFLHGKPGAGFLFMPQQMNRKITDAFQRARYLVKTPAFSAQIDDEQLRAGFEDLAAGEGLSEIKYRPILDYILQRWEAGKEARKGRGMIVTYQDLSSRSLLPENRRHPERQRAEIGRLSALLLTFIGYDYLKDKGITINLGEDGLMFILSPSQSGGLAPQNPEDLSLAP